MRPAHTFGPGTYLTRRAAAKSGDKKVQAKAVTMDFSKLDDAAQWQRLQSEIAGLDIGVLGEYMRYFDLLPSCPPSALGSRKHART